MAHKLLTVLVNAGLNPLNVVVFLVVFAVASKYPRECRRLFASLGKLPLLITSFAVPLIARAALLPWLPIPNPKIHDEFSYLLAADTFSRGRLTNPTHPLWQFFESFHIFHTPTYMSMYPPAQGMILAFGKAIFGHPWWGEFLSMGLMCATVAWALRAWLPKPWALLGGLATGFSYCIGYYWMNSYWGGAAAAIGGALLLGAAGRLVRFRAGKPVYGIVAGIGIAALANSRPWEGILLSFPVMVYVAFCVFSTERIRRFRGVAIACTAVLAITGLAMMYYCWRITGRATELPYAHDRAMYAIAPLLPWQTIRAAHTYRHGVMRRLYVEWEPSYQNAMAQNNWRIWLSSLPFRYRAFKDQYIGNAFAVLILLFLIPMLKSRVSRMVVIVLAFFLVGSCIQRYYASHYFAPVLAAAMAVQMFVLRRIYAWSQPVALALLACAVPMLVTFNIQALEIVGSPFADSRAASERRLMAIPGEHLVFVKYSDNHPLNEEWVYNGADIDSQRVVWARDLRNDNKSLERYYPNRRVWILSPDSSQPVAAQIEAQVRSAVSSR